MAKTGFDLASILGDVSKLDTGLQPDGREQIEYIDLSLIDPDPNNFYEMTDIEELAANIELLGLQQPLRVRPNPDKPERLIIVSGHRRRAALELLVGDGKTQFAQVPCIREAGDQSAALQELRLIYANSDTRKLTSPELSKQAERVEALLYQLKEEGMDFPGRMRDHVAEACKVSKSKLARLKVIREKLDESFLSAYQDGTIAESVAYALAQQPVEIQRAVHDYKCTGKNGAKYLREWQVESVAETYKGITGQKCKMGGQCIHAGNLLEKIYDDTNSYKPCEYRKCCNECERLSSCKSACPKLKDKVQKLKADKKAAAQQEKLAKEEKERPDIEQITRLWVRFGEARAAAGKSVRQIIEAADMYYTKSDDEKYKALESGGRQVTTSTGLPYSYGFSLTDVRRLISIADCLGCSLDYLFCRTDEPRAKWEEHDASVPVTATAWHTGTPPMSGEYIVKLALQDEQDEFIKAFLDFDRYNSEWSYEYGEPLDTSLAKVIGWIQLPEEDEE